MRTILTTILVLSLILFSCKKKVEKVSPEFIGKWYSNNEEFTNVYLGVDENSEAEYNIQVTIDGVHGNYTGIARANNRRFKIGRTKYFDIIEYPHLIDTLTDKHRVYDYSKNVFILANWKMVLEGMKPSSFYVTGKYEFYKAEY